MKFSELKDGDKFTTANLEDRVLTKVPYRRPTCCSPEHNSVDGANKKFMIQGDAEVELRE